MALNYIPLHKKKDGGIYILTECIADMKTGAKKNFNETKKVISSLMFVH